MNRGEVRINKCVVIYYRIAQSYISPKSENVIFKICRGTAVLRVIKEIYKILHVNHIQDIDLNVHVVDILLKLSDVGAFTLKIEHVQYNIISVNSEGTYLLRICLMVVNLYSNADFKLVYCRVVFGNFLRIVYT